MIKKGIKSEKIINPEIIYCFNKCGEKVKNHHWLCDDCYSKKRKEEDKQKRIKLMEQQKNNFQVKRRLKL